MKSLADIFAEHGTDKLTLGYTPLYESLFAHRREDVRHVTEIGIGTLIPNVESSMVGYGAAHYKPGASLRAWRDYFPKASIIGVDTQPDTKIVEERIWTIIADSTDPVAVHASMPYVAPRDFIVDDGSHQYHKQIATLENFWTYLKPGGTYIVEDLVSPDMFRNQDRIRQIVGGAPFYFTNFGPVGILVITKI